MSFYEKHIYDDPNFPVMFHKDFLPHDEYVPVHWHENIEILLISKGSGFVLSDAERIECECGDIVLINSNNLHTVHPYNNSIEYYCLIIGRAFCEKRGVKYSNNGYCSLIKDNEINKIFYDIDNEFKEQPPYYKSYIKALTVCLMVRLLRFHQRIKVPNTNIGSKNAKAEITKKAIEYIMENFKNPITIDQICQNISFSKYYLCHAFKEITGQSVIDYINFMRCQNAKDLLISGQYSVKECAGLSGFYNSSAFSVTFKKHMGVLPSKVINTQE